MAKPNPWQPSERASQPARPGAGKMGYIEHCAIPEVSAKRCQLLIFMFLAGNSDGAPSTFMTFRNISPCDGRGLDSKTIISGKEREREKKVKKIAKMALKTLAHLFFSGN